MRQTAETLFVEPQFTGEMPGHYRATITLASNDFWDHHRLVDSLEFDDSEMRDHAVLAIPMKEFVAEARAHVFTPRATDEDLKNVFMDSLGVSLVYELELVKPPAGVSDSLFFVRFPFRTSTAGIEGKVPIPGTDMRDGIAPWKLIGRIPGAEPGRVQPLDVTISGTARSRE